ARASASAVSQLLYQFRIRARSCSVAVARHVPAAGASAAEGGAAGTAWHAASASPAAAAKMNLLRPHIFALLAWSPALLRESEKNPQGAGSYLIRRPSSRHRRSGSRR